MSIAGYEYGGQYKTDDNVILEIGADVSPTTVEAVLGAMVKNGSIKRIGASRSTRYIKT